MELIPHEYVVFLWFALFFLLITRISFGKIFVCGLGICHLFNLALIHFFTEFFIGEDFSLAAVGLSVNERQAGLTGFRLTGYAICSLICAFILVQFLGKKFGFLPSSIQFENGKNFPSALFPTIALLFGLFCYFSLVRILSFIPSITSILGCGLALATAGMTLLYYVVYNKSGPISGLAISCLAVIFPLLTLVFSGFLGFGIYAVISVLCFMLAVHKPKWHMFLIIPIVIYFGLSLYPSYMLARNAIRAKVWGETAMFERLSVTFSELLDNWQWFDPNDPDQLVAMNGRLNQNVLVGFSYNFMEGGSAEFANGETLINGLLALIPRVIWPDKPIKGGSGTLVTQYAGIVVPDSTSIGIGNVMELYVNFGPSGVIVGFLFIGLVVYFLDELGGVYLSSGRYQEFLLTFMVGQTFMNVIGSFVEWGPNLAGAFLFMYFFSKIVSNLNIEGSLREGI